ncbi:MAG: HEAT repeat domain-containing protein [Phycisphaerae bacterium]
MTRRIFQAMVVTWIAALPLRAERLSLKDGRVFDGAVVSETDAQIRLRVMHGVVDVEKDEVAMRQPGDPPWVRYDQEKSKHADTAAGHFELAQWCREQSLSTLARAELRIALQRDPDYEPARVALGYVRQGREWVMPKRPAKPEPATEEKARREEERLTRQIVSRWHTTVNQIRTSKLDGRGRDESSRLFAAGRKQIMDIRDPLAIPAIAAVLSGGTEPTRRLMVEALARFPEDDATLNLTVIALFDPSPQVRRRAAEVLLPRHDGRVVRELRDALQSDEEAVLRNAAVALGVLRAVEAVPDLIPRLETRFIGPVNVPRSVLVTGLLGCFCGPTLQIIDGFPVYYYPPEVAVLGYGTVIGTYWATEIGVVSIYRTEVQEALIAISGQNLGFDHDAWQRWFDAHAKP